MSALSAGTKFVKHAFGSGKPAERSVHYDATTATLFWCAPGQRVKNKAKSISLDSIIAVYVGKHTPPFSRGQNTYVASSQCLSIKCAKRTLDLQAASQEVRDAWIEGLASLLSTSVEFHGWPISTAELGTVTTLTDKATVTNLEKELAARTQTVDDLTKDLTAVRVDLGELEKLTEHVARADEHAKRADQRISELERERDGLEEALDQTEGADHDADMQLRITSLQSELANSQALIAKKEELDQQVATMSVELEAFRQSAASFKQEHLTLRERISSLDRERESMQVALGEAQEAAAARATLQPAFSASVPKVEEARTLLMEAEAKHEATTGRLKMEAASLWTRLQTEIDHNAGEQKRQAEEVVRRQSLGEEQATRVVVNLKRKIEELQARSLQAEQSSQTSVVVSEEMTALRVENRRLTEALRLSTVEEAASDTAGGETVSEAVDVVAAVGVGVEEDVARLKGEVLVLRQERLVEQVVHAELVAEVRDYTQALAAAKNTLEQEQEQHRHGLERQQQEHRQIIDQYTRDDKDSPQENTVSDSIDMHSRIDFLEKERLRLEEVVERNARDMVAESAVQSELEAEIGSLERELVDVRRKAEAQTGTCLLEETVGQELKDRATQLQHEVDEALRKHKVQAREHQIITHEAEGVARGLRERILELEGEREEHDIAENEQQVSELEEEVADLQNRLERATAHNQDLTARLSTGGELFEKFKRSVGEAEGNVSNAEAMATDLRREVEESTRELEQSEEAHKKELEQVQEAHKRELELMIEAHKSDIEQIKEAHKSDVEQIEEAHKSAARELEQIKETHESDIEQIKEAHKSDMEQTKEAHKSDVVGLKTAMERREVEMAAKLDSVSEALEARLAQERTTYQQQRNELEQEAFSVVTEYSDLEGQLEHMKALLSSRVVEYATLQSEHELTVLALKKEMEQKSVEAEAVRFASEVDSNLVLRELKTKSAMLVEQEAKQSKVAEERIASASELAELRARLRSEQSHTKMQQAELDSLRAFETGLKESGDRAARDGEVSTASLRLGLRSLEGEVTSQIAHHEAILAGSNSELEQPAVAVTPAVTPPPLAKKAPPKSMLKAPTAPGSMLKRPNIGK